MGDVLHLFNVLISLRWSGGHKFFWYAVQHAIFLGGKMKLIGNLLNHKGKQLSNGLLNANFNGKHGFKQTGFEI